jgi:hypothetical protein
MAAKWQRWMPMEIDALKASPAVQAMHPSARAGYVWLLLDAWQTDDCTIPSDPLDLADKSGLGDELWAAHGIRILRKFERIDGSDRLRNLPQYERWQAAKVVYDKRHENADRTNERRISSNSATKSDTLSSRSSSSENLPLEPPLITGTETETKIEKPKKQKPSRSESGKSPDHRHQECKEAIRDYWDSKNPEMEMPWDGSEGKILGMFLSANPKLTAVGIRRLVAHRGNSEVNHADRPSKWVRSLTSFNQGPIDRFGKPLGLNGGKNGTVSNGRSEGNLAVFTESTSGMEREEITNPNGLFPASENGSGNPRTIHGVFTPAGPPSLSSGDGNDFGF